MKGYKKRMEPKAAYQTQMTPAQALEILDRITAQVPLNRADQFAVLRALQVLGELAQPPAPPPAEPIEKVE